MFIHKIHETLKVVKVIQNVITESTNIELRFDQNRTGEMRPRTESYLQMESQEDPRWSPASEMDRLRLGQHYTGRVGRWRCLLTLC